MNDQFQQDRGKEENIYSKFSALTTFHDQDSQDDQHNQYDHGDHTSSGLSGGHHASSGLSGGPDDLAFSYEAAKELLFKCDVCPKGFASRWDHLCHVRLDH